VYVIRRLVATAVVACAVSGASGCSQDYYDERGKGDAPVSGERGDDVPAEVHNFPDGFGNLATKCVGPGLRGYATTKGVMRGRGEEEKDVFLPARAIVVRDPQCG